MQARNNIKTEKQCEAVQEVVHYYLVPSVGYQLMTNMARMASKDWFGAVVERTE